MARPSADYRPRRPADSVLYQVVREHYATFRTHAAARRDGEGLPAFIEDEFEGFLRCGWLAGGFARFHCGGCGLDRLVPFSCKGRAVCPSCGGRRMAERAAHLVEHVFPPVPVRQWVLSLPHGARYALAWDHALCRRVVAVFMRAVLGQLRRRARTQGVSDCRGGAVAILQRFGAALNVNVHVHALVLDGVFLDGPAGLRFCPADPPTDVEMDSLLGTIARRVTRVLRRRGVGPGRDDRSEQEDPWAAEAPALAALAGASVQGRAALGPRAGAPVRRCGVRLSHPAPTVLGPCHARVDGFDLHAGVVVDGRDRARLERVCRYALRPPIAHDRVRLTNDGEVLLALRHPWADGTTHLLFDPIELLERLAALTPRPRINLILYYGVLGARSAWRARLGEVAAPVPTSPHQAHAPPAETAARPANPRWAALMQHSFGYDVLACPRCGGRLRLIALIESGPAAQRILRHLGLAGEVPAAWPARAPPASAGHLSDDDFLA